MTSSIMLHLFVRLRDTKRLLRQVPPLMTPRAHLYQISIMDQIQRHLLLLHTPDVVQLIGSNIIGLFVIMLVQFVEGACRVGSS